MIKFSKKLYKSYPEILSDFKHKRFVSDSDVTPFHFYEKYLPHSKEVWLKFGYFSTNAIRTLSLSFARFIYKGGKATIITNHFYNKQDAEKLFDNTEIDYSIIDHNFNSIEKIKSLLESEKQHFFNCLRYLLEKGKLKIQPVRKIDGSMSHFKEGVFLDNSNNYIGFNGSCNFTVGGLMVNGESLDIKTSWGDEIDKNEILDKKAEIDSIINGEDCSYEQLNSSELEIVIKKEAQKKELNELLQDEREINKRYQSQKNDIIYKEILIEYEKEKNEPKFPFDEPRQYQIDAYQAWEKNEFKGLFAMATGTGKTITSLNCLLNEYKKNGNYSAVILVPTVSLASQWEDELKSFNFSNIINQSKDTSWRTELRNAKNAFNSINRNFIFISTYQTFFKDETFFLLNDESISKKLTLISDECHALGTKSALQKLNLININKRIGLSATPNRNYDNIGTEAICDFFNASEPYYTYFYSMNKAIKDGVLCEFEYHPKFISLNQKELDEYYNYTKRLRKYINPDGGYKICKESETLLILRKNIVHKASGKLPLMSEIINEIGEENFKSAFIYVPEGFVPDYDSKLSIDEYQKDHNRIINNYSKLLGEKYNFKVINFGGDTPKKERIKILDLFENGFYHALISMKCLDEGIDIPVAKLAIFCSSTGNPRQFVQRRGRVLRSYKKQEAVIYDMVVKPDFESITNESDLKSEINIFKSELTRIINFLALAKNKDEIIEKDLDEICNEIGINNIYELINSELERH